MGDVINGYGLMVTAGIVAGAYAASKFKVQSAKFKINSGEIWDVLPWVIIPGIFGARLYHVVDWWWYYQDNLRLIPAVWTGGLGIFGGIGGGVVGLGWWIHKTYKSNKTYMFLNWLDVIAVGAPLGQAIGRWGNWFNQELYGKASDLPWAIYIQEEKARFHPLFLYESLWNFLVFGVMWWVSQKLYGRWASGTGFATYVGLYSLGRFWLEGLRLESWMIVGVRVAQGISLGLMMVSLLFVWMKNRDRLNFRRG